MEEGEAPAAPVLVGEMKEVMTAEGEREESIQETVLTTVTTLTTVVDTTTRRMDIEEVETDIVTEAEEEKEEMEKEGKESEIEEDEKEAEMEGGEEENGEKDESQAKKLLETWETEVRTSCDF